MKVFKFGGASVKDAQAIENLVQILKFEKATHLLIVISAMGKTTNALEKIVRSYFHNQNTENDILTVENYHFDIINQLFENKNHPVFSEIQSLFLNLREILNTSELKDYNYLYDQVVSLGEIISTKIVSAFLIDQNIKNTWLDSRNLIRIDDLYREAIVDWNTTEKLISTHVNTSHISITQGFLGGYQSNTTTLGREGSDYTAAIFAYCLKAESVTIWKDVDGVLNAHPKHFSKTKLLNQISYKEATEMAFYGASVLHPKTLKPLENRLIPLTVRSFKNWKNKGTKIQKGEDIEPKVPCYILKENQILISISALDFSFMVENNLSDIFKELHNFKLKVSLIQNSALSFSVCVEDKFNNFELFYNKLKPNYKVTYNTSLKLYTIRHFNTKAISNIVNGTKVYLKQSSRETIQIVTE